VLMSGGVFYVDTDAMAQLFRGQTVMWSDRSIASPCRRVGMNFSGGLLTEPKGVNETRCNSRRWSINYDRVSWGCGASN